MLPIDHVTVAGVDLQRMRTALSAVGIETVYGGAHSDGATEMASVSFPDGSYLELIAPQSHAGLRVVESHPWSCYLSGEAGPCAWAVSIDDLDAEIRRLQSAGIAVSSPAANGRLRPDGVRLEWRIVTCGSGAPGSFFPFLIEDLTARDLRAFPHGMPGNRDYHRVARLVLAVRNLDFALARYRQAYGLASGIKQADPAFAAHVAVLRDAPIVLAEPLDSDSWLAARLEQFGEAPCAVLLEAVDPQRHPGAAQSRWSHLDIQWFDSKALGWRLGTVGIGTRFSLAESINY
jgi:hypothetical protein